ncbi:MAG: YHS domain protein [Cytophagaceae bacterium]|nr:YHS domain protein [Cytophagaceae bacterium]
MKSKRFLRVFFFVLLSSSTLAFGQTTALRQKQFLVKDGLALQGYDPVSYFSGKPQRGQAANKLTYNGITYRFTNAANLNDFKQNPARYEPQYGGWCAFAMGDSGEKVEVDPETFKVLDGKLYLFYNKFFNNTLKFWNKDEARLHRQADVNWTKVFGPQPFHGGPKGAF